MPRASLAGLLPALASVALAGPSSPHVSQSLVLTGCAACHEGHGVSRSPMLPGPQKGLCLECHGTQTDVEERIREGVLAPQARPPLLGSALSLPSRHPIDEEALSGHEPRSVTCTSCHSPHRGMPPDRQTQRPTGEKMASPKDPGRLEHELCGSCHGGAAGALAGRSSVDQLVDPASRSYHPVKAPTVDRSPSVIRLLAGKEINCTDCHGSADPASARGPHGSPVEPLLLLPYDAIGGSRDPGSAYALCASCHVMEILMRRSPFPQHATHVERSGASCATCHNAHGSTSRRALIRFGDEPIIPAVTPSIRTGRLEFLSEAPGSGECYLTCHGVDHDPKSYRGIAPREERDRGITRSISVPTRRPGRRSIQAN